MVKNNHHPHSLRSSVSNHSLHTSPSISVQEAAARERIAELEAQVASLSRQITTSTTGSSSIEPVQGQQGKTADFLSRARPYSTEEEDSYDEIASQPKGYGEKLTLENVRALLRMREQKIAAEQSSRGDMPVLAPRTSETSRGSHAPMVPILPFPPRPWRAGSEDEELELPEGTTLFEKFNEDMGRQLPRRSLITKGLVREAAEEFRLKSPEAYTKPFCDFLTENPTVFHAVTYFEKKLDRAGFTKVLLFPPCLMLNIWLIGTRLSVV